MSMNIRELESTRHLFQRPMYQNPSGAWSYDFNESLQNCPKQVHLDIAAIVSFLSFGMVGLDRTLLQEIARRPWMSEVTVDGQVVKEPIPPHGFLTNSDEIIANCFYQLLCEEACTACNGFREIYVLLSGGLDSRIIAGVLANLYRAGEITTKPKAVTWGLPDSRDVVYARQIAKILDLEWQNIEFGPEVVLENIDATVNKLGLLHSPEMLHNMMWFKNIPQASLVIAGSFGDSIGRAEFSGLHLLNLVRKKPENTYALLKPGVYQTAAMELNRDLKDIYTRAKGDIPWHARNEHWMQGYRMRGGLCHALSIINNYATIYQMYTAPAVYEYMWSLHPSRRDDNIYAAMLEQKFPQLARIPWPRTNSALHGKTIGARQALRPNYHEYTKWSSGPLYGELSKRIDPEWFAATGLFNPQSIWEVNELVKKSQERVGRLNDIWLWLAGFRSFIEYIERNGKKLIIPPELTNSYSANKIKSSIVKHFWGWGVNKSQLLNASLKRVRGYYRRINLKFKKRKMLQKYNPVYDDK